MTETKKLSTKKLNKLATAGDADAQNALGFRYSMGRGVPIDGAEAVKWYRLAADQGHATAQTNLGRCYSTGEGVSKNSKEGARWFRLAADRVQL